MFSKQVLWSDKFIDLPSPAQVLYFQLSMYADDEGFVNCAGYVRRLTGCSESDIEALCKNGFIIPFESGVYLSLIHIWSDFRLAVGNVRRHRNHTE